MPKSLYRPEYEAFLCLLRETRLAAGLTQQQVADRVGRPQSFVSKLESGERRCDVVELRDLCAVLGVEPAEFMRRLDVAVERDRSPG